MPKYRLYTPFLQYVYQAMIFSFLVRWVFNILLENVLRIWKLFPVLDCKTLKHYRQIKIMR